MILRVDLIGGIPAEEIPLITERQAGTYPRPVARTRGGEEGGRGGGRESEESEGDARASRVGIHIALHLTPRVVHTRRVSVSIS